MIDNFLVAQIIFVAASLLGVIGIQQKKKGTIFLFFALSTLTAAIAFVFLEAYPGTVSLLMMSTFAAVSYFFDKKNKPIPKWLSVVFVALIIIAGLFTVKVATDAIPLFASTFFVLSVIQNKEKRVRYLTLVTLILWVTYDTITQAYSAVLTDGLFAASTAIAIIRYDFLKKKRS